MLSHIVESCWLKNNTVHSTKTSVLSFSSVLSLSISLDEISNTSLSNLTRPWMFLSSQKFRIYICATTKYWSQRRHFTIGSVMLHNRYTRGDVEWNGKAARFHFTALNWGPRDAPQRAFCRWGVVAAFAALGRNYVGWVTRRGLRAPLRDGSRIDEGGW